MAGITDRDKDFINGSLQPIKESIEIIIEHQKELSNKYSNIEEKMNDFVDIQNAYILDFELLKKQVNGNGSKGMKDILKDHIKEHACREKEKKENENKKIELKNKERSNNKALVVTMCIAILGAITSIITSIISLGGWYERYFEKN